MIIKKTILWHDPFLHPEIHISPTTAIASDPDEQYVFNIHDFDYLSDVAEKITPKSCAIAVTNGEWSLLELICKLQCI